MDIRASSLIAWHKLQQSVPIARLWTWHWTRIDICGWIYFPCMVSHHYSQRSFLDYAVAIASKNILGKNSVSHGVSNSYIQVLLEIIEITYLEESKQCKCMVNFKDFPLMVHCFPCLPCTWSGRTTHSLLLWYQLGLGVPTRWSALLVMHGTIYKPYKWP